jgi:hypothetical protein
MEEYISKMSSRKVHCHGYDRWAYHKHCKTESINISEDGVKLGIFWWFCIITCQIDTSWLHLDAIKNKQPSMSIARTKEAFPNKATMHTRVRHKVKHSQS